MATFTVHGVNRHSVRVVGTYKVDRETGVLMVKPDKGKPFIMSPAGWAQVDIEDAPSATDMFSAEAGGDPQVW